MKVRPLPYLLSFFVGLLVGFIVGWVLDKLAHPIPAWAVWP